MRDQNEVVGVAATVVLGIEESREMACGQAIPGARHQRGEAVCGNDPPDGAHPPDRIMGLEEQRRL
jgi:hypothetical protein